MAASEKVYGSEYEKAVLTAGHPAKATFMNPIPPDYIAKSSMGPWLATRVEELVVVIFMASVFIYCASGAPALNAPLFTNPVLSAITPLAVYVFGYVVTVKPMIQMCSLAWDVMLLSAFVSFAVGRKARKRVNGPLFVLTAAVACARYRYEWLYPWTHPLW